MIPVVLVPDPGTVRKASTPFRKETSKETKGITLSYTVSVCASLLGVLYDSRSRYLQNNKLY